ncbi:MAG: bifunctional sugar-1-phosphate nucleotidylyltransferase/acetyltransferase [Halodesulfurarchaeum sp.]
MKAVILAAGAGRRLEPLTNRRPKPMIPLANKPLLEYVLEAVTEAGVEEIVLVVGYERERIQSYFGDGDDWGVDIEYAQQPKQIGTGDAVLQAESFVDDEFLVLNGDRVIDASLIERVIEHRKASGEDVLAVTRSEEPGLYGMVTLDDESYVTDIVEKPASHEIDSDLINAGVYAFGTDVFEAIRETSRMGELELTDVLTGRLEDLDLRAVPYDGRWLDVTRPWDLLSVNGRLLDDVETSRADSASIDSRAAVADAVLIGENSTIYPNASLLRGTAVGDNVQIGPNVTIRNSLVFPDVTVGAGSVVADAVVGSNVTLGPNTTIAGGDADVVLGDTIHRDVRFGAMIGDNATVGASVTVAPGSFLGNGSRIEIGSTVDGRIEPGAILRR